MAPAQAYKPLTTTEHLDAPDAQPDFKIPSRLQRVETRREKCYRLVFRSGDRVAGTATNAVFDLGDLRGAWLMNDNLDAGAKHWEARVVSFHIDGDDIDTPFLEIHGTNWPVQAESFDSATRGPTALLSVASGPVAASTESMESPFTLRELPRGRVGIRLLTPFDQATLDADATTKWQLVVALTPTSY